MLATGGDGMSTISRRSVLLALAAGAAHGQTRVHRKPIDQIRIEISLRTSGLWPLILIPSSSGANLHRGQLSGCSTHREVGDQSVFVSLSGDVARDRLHSNRADRESVTPAPIREDNRVATVASGCLGARDSGLEGCGFDARASDCLAVESRDLDHQYVGARADL